MHIKIEPLSIDDIACECCGFAHFIIGKRFSLEIACASVEESEYPHFAAASSSVAPSLRKAFAVLIRNCFK